MALSLTINGRIPTDVLATAIRAACPDAEEHAAPPRTFAQLGTAEFSATVGGGTTQQASPGGELECCSYAVFRLDKNTRQRAAERVLDCIRSVLERTSEDFVLVHMDEDVILTRLAGGVRIYRYGSERSFWDVHDPGRWLGAAVELETVDRPAENEDDDGDDWDDGGDD